MSASPPTVLARILEETRAEVERRKRERPIAPPSAQEPIDFPVAGGRFHEALLGPGVGVIAEFKRRSPSAGALREAPDLQRMIAAYAAGGAAALSVLTEGPNFGGALEDLQEAREVCGLPILRKDFVVDAYQLAEAREAGADAVLLIVAALDDGELAELHTTALSLGLDALVEVHDADELERAVAVGARIVGVNNRDLRDFSVDIRRTAELMDAMPENVTVVSESGIGERAQVEALESSGVRAVLVGEALMRAADPAAALRSLLY
jgi:indole-3-glycerol phosphate synthase